jgi:hypothetical protein
VIECGHVRTSRSHVYSARLGRDNVDGRGLGARDFYRPDLREAVSRAGGRIAR